MSTFAATPLTLEHDAVDLTDYDLTFYDYLSVQYAGPGSGTIVLEGSNDGVLWYSGGLTPIAGGTVVTTVATAGIWFHAIVARWYRVRKSVAGTGAVNVTVNIHRGG